MVESCEGPCQVTVSRSRWLNERRLCGWGLSPVLGRGPGAVFEALSRGLRELVATQTLSPEQTIADTVRTARVSSPRTRTRRVALPHPNVLGQLLQRRRLTVCIIGNKVFLSIYQNGHCTLDNQK